MSALGGTFSLLNSLPFPTELRSSPNKDTFAIMSEASVYLTEAAYNASHMAFQDSEDLELMYFFTIFNVYFVPFIYYNMYCSAYATSTAPFTYASLHILALA